jgi:hypothetical protein
VDAVAGQESPRRAPSRGGVGNAGRSYDVSADGQQFLVIKISSTQNLAATAPSLVVVEHWTEELKARAGTK